MMFALHSYSHHRCCKCPVKHKSSFALILLVALLGFSCHRDWDEVEAFERGLSCGMSVHDVQRLATRLGARELRRPALAGRDSTIPDYYVSKNERLVSL